MGSEKLDLWKNSDGVFGVPADRGGVIAIFLGRVFNRNEVKFKNIVFV